MPGDRVSGCGQAVSVLVLLTVRGDLPLVYVDDIVWIRVVHLQVDDFLYHSSALNLDDLLVFFLDLWFDAVAPGTTGSGSLARWRRSHRAIAI